MTTQIHDLGYRAYEGERAGLWWAVRSLAMHSIRRALGLKRQARHKIAPVLTIGFAFAPALVLAGLAAFLGSELIGELIGFGEYFGTTNFALLIYTAAVVPGVLTTDRANGMLAMYLASPLNRTTYLAAKALGLFAVMLIVTAGPIVFLILAYALAGTGPEGVLGFAETLGRAAVAGSLAGALFTAFGVFVSSIPKRWGTASAAIFGGLAVPRGITSGLTEEGGFSDWYALLSPDAVMNEAWQFVMDDRTRDYAALDVRSGPLLVAVVLGYIASFLGASWWRYQTMKVER